MVDFGDERDFIVQAPHVAHGHATQGRHKIAGPGSEGYSLYPARADVLRCILGLRNFDLAKDAVAKGTRAAADYLAGDGPPPVASIFEFGTLSGYCLIALGAATVHEGWEPRLGWCDDESTEPGSNERARENLEVVGLEAAFVCTDRRDAPAFGRAHLVCVDGDHSYENTLDDIAYGMLMRPGAILVDDVIPTHQGVIDAVNQVAGCAWDCFRIPTVNGLAVLDFTAGLRAMMGERGWVTEEMPV